LKIQRLRPKVSAHQRLRGGRRVSVVVERDALAVDAFSSVDHLERPGNDSLTPFAMREPTVTDYPLLEPTGWQRV
jgi:hypothetical protein